MHSEGSTNNSGSEYLKLLVIGFSEEGGGTSANSDDEVFEPGLHGERSDDHQSNHKSTNTGEEHSSPVFGETLEEPATNASEDEGNNRSGNDRNLGSSTKREEDVSESHGDTSDGEEGKELKGEQEESGTNENEGKTAENLKSSEEHSEFLKELQVDGLASVLGLSAEGQRAVITSLGPGDGLAIIGGVTLDVEVDEELLIGLGCAVSVGHERDSESIVLSFSLIRVDALESRFVESVLAFVVRVFSAVGLSNTEASSRGGGFLDFLGQFFDVGASGISGDSIFLGSLRRVHLVLSVTEGTLEQFKSISALVEHGVVGSDVLELLNLLEATETLVGLGDVSSASRKEADNTSLGGFG